MEEGFQGSLAGILSALMGLVYFSAGGIKLYPLHQGAFQMQVKDFQDYASVFPLNPPDPDTFRQVVGIAEVLLGVGLLLGPRSVKRYSSMGCMLIMTGAFFTLWRLGKYGQTVVPLTFFVTLSWLYKKMDSRKDKEE